MSAPLSPSRSVLPLVSKVAGSLAFNPHLRGVAARVVDAITGGGRRPFNGVHLRVEKDALDWVKIMRGKGVRQPCTALLAQRAWGLGTQKVPPLWTCQRLMLWGQPCALRSCTCAYIQCSLAALCAVQSLWHLYIVAMREAGFNGSMPLFVASGLLTYSQGATSGDWLEAVEILTHRNLASEVHYKEEFVPDFELAGGCEGARRRRRSASIPGWRAWRPACKQRVAQRACLLEGEPLAGDRCPLPLLHPPIVPPAGLNQEQRALIDFLVLARAQRFVGFGSSTFSYYLREYRALHYGLPHSTSLLLNTTRIGTDALFAAAGRVAAAGGEEGLGGAPAASGCTGLLRWLRLECWWGLHGGWR